MYESHANPGKKKNSMLELDFQKSIDEYEKSMHLEPAGEAQ